MREDKLELTKILKKLEKRVQLGELCQVECRGLLRVGAETPSMKKYTNKNRKRECNDKKKTFLSIFRLSLICIFSLMDLRA